MSGNDRVFAVVVNLGIISVQFLIWNGWRPVFRREPVRWLFTRHAWGVSVERSPHAAEWAAEYRNYRPEC